MRRKRTEKKEVTIDEIRDTLIEKIKLEGMNVKTFSESEKAEELFGDKAKHLRVYLTKGGKTFSLAFANTLANHFGLKPFTREERKVVTVTYYTT